MTNDSKLALVLGILLVMLMGIVFFRKEGTSARAPEGPAPAHIEAANRGTARG